MKNKIYITLRENGSLINPSLQTLEDAAKELITFEGHVFEIRKQGGRFALFISQYSANRSGGKGEMQDWIGYGATSEEGVYRNIIRKGGVYGSYAVDESFLFQEKYGLLSQEA